MLFGKKGVCWNGKKRAVRVGVLDDLWLGVDCPRNSRCSAFPFGHSQPHNVPGAYLHWLFKDGLRGRARLQRNEVPGKVHEQLIQAMPHLSQLLDDGNSLMIHCSAGVHRTGTIAYGLLRWRGVKPKEAMDIIMQARKETAEGMQEKRMRWGDENARPLVQKDQSWLHSVKELLNQLITKLFKSH